jgi:hypothetical protein
VWLHRRGYFNVGLWAFFRYVFLGGGCSLLQALEVLAYLTNQQFEKSAVCQTCSQVQVVVSSSSYQPRLLTRMASGSLTGLGPRSRSKVEHGSNGLMIVWKVKF